MARSSVLVGVMVLLLTLGTSAQASKGTDVLKTSGGDLKVTHIGHGSVMFEYRGKVIHVDPFSKMGDYAKLPKADLVLITHDHFDHLDLDALGKIRTDKTLVVLTKECAEKAKGGIVISNGDVKTVADLKIEAVPAYNIAHKRDSGDPFHPKGRGNGYVISFGDCRVYVAGDTENIPEMKDLKDIRAAFLPINLPYTMTGAMVVDAAKSFRPQILYPYHYDMGKTDLPKLPELMKEVKGVDLRVIKKK
ncbi:MAG: MBL fold metallo-hydrolase [Thermodesulfobacteriota bacterium]